MDSTESYLQKQRYLRAKINEQLNRKSIKYNWHEAEVSILEGAFARGDRRLSKVLYDAYKAGCLYDSWSECFKYDTWIKAFEENLIDIDFYTTREREKEEILPWDFIDVGVTKEFLWREYTRGINEKVTPNCRKACVDCGAKIFNGGVCYEEKEILGEAQ